MDHWSNIFTVGLMPQLSSAYFEGLRPNGVYVPRFRNLSGQDADADFVRGYGFQGRAACIDPKALGMRMRGFGQAFKQSLREPAWIFWLSAFGECLPHKENAISLDARSVDRFGIPQVRFSFQWSDNERKMTQDALSQGKAMLEAVGAQAVRNLEDAAVGGDSVHEMGGARMGNDPAQSVLNAWNQVHDIPNLYVADGACMASSSCVNPSLTYMALTARAADHASTGLRAGTI
jgi:choline dehydrogenase-like flavoprotein